LFLSYGGVIEARIPRIAASNSTNAVSFSSASTTKRFPSQCASAIQIVRSWEPVRIAHAYQLKVEKAYGARRSVIESSNPDDVNHCCQTTSLVGCIFRFRCSDVLPHNGTTSFSGNLIQYGVLILTRTWRFQSFGNWSVALMVTVGIGCAFAAIGLWKGTLLGVTLALIILSLNIVGDLFNG
jgi:hypothetical protein